MKKGAIYTVNYNSTDDTIQFLTSITKQYVFNNLDIYIIDNSNDYGPYNAIKEYIVCNKLNNCVVYKSETNLGYFGAVNTYIKKGNKLSEDYDFMVICNNDILIEDKHFFDKVFKYSMIEDVIAPSIISLPGQNEQNPHRKNKMTSREIIFYKVFFSHYLLSRSLILLKKFLHRRKIINSYEKMKIYSPHGAFVIFTNNFFSKGGYIDDGYFLYGEEESIGKICEMFQLTINFVPELQVFHNEHKSTSSKSKRSIYRYQRKAYKYLKSKYGIYKKN